MCVDVHILSDIIGKKKGEYAFEKRQVVPHHTVSFLAFKLSNAILTKARQCTGPHACTLYNINFVLLL